MQVQVCAKMVMFNWLVKKVSGKDKWRCATMECGEQCVLMAGVILLLVLSVINWDTQTLVSYVYMMLCYVLILSLSTNIGGAFTNFRWENSPIIFNNIACNETHSTLLQCFGEHNIGVFDCGGSKTAGVICEMPMVPVAVSICMHDINFVLPRAYKPLVL